MWCDVPLEQLGWGRDPRLCPSCKTKTEGKNMNVSNEDGRLRAAVVALREWLSEHMKAGGRDA